MNPPREATEARCPACRQTVQTALLRTDGTVVLCLCPYCGVVWSAWPLPPWAEAP
jgi:uncharacterized Zn finger protein